MLTNDHRIYPACPILASGDCKRESGIEHARVVQTVMDGINAQRATTKLWIVSLASDGEARRGSAFAFLTFKKKIIAIKTGNIYLSAFRICCYGHEESLSMDFRLNLTSYMITFDLQSSLPTISVHL